MVEYITFLPIIVGYLLVRICTIRSAVRPSQRSGSSPLFHLPFINVSIALARRTGSSPTSSFVPIRHVSGCSAYVLSVIHGMPKNVASSATLPESVMIPFALFIR